MTNIPPPESATDDSACQEIAARLRSALRAVVFTGAGVSTESGIPDFRSPGGVWAKYRPVYFDEFLADPAARHEYWRQKSEAHREFAASRPNVGHEVLARWETAGKVRGVITQNIDGLHQIAGSRAVLELHGTAREASCLDCGERYPIDPLVAEFLRLDVPPSCGKCSGRLKHATISFGQALPEATLLEAAQWCQQADVMLAIGSSLVVPPAAELPALAKRSGAYLAILNRDPTPLDSAADAIVRRPIGQALSAIDVQLQSALE